MAEIRISSLFKKTAKIRAREVKNLKEVLNQFIDFKRKNPKQPINPKDSPLTGGSLKDARLWHYDIGRSLRLYYNVTEEGKNIFVNLFGIFTHDETGTGQPAQRKVQDQFATKVGTWLRSMEVVKASDPIVEMYSRLISTLRLG